MSESEKHLMIVDGHALLYRAFFALPIMTAPDGTFTNAVYGFTRIMLHVIAELNPTHLFIAFDSKGDTFRKKEFEDYKAHRKPMPEELLPQIETTQSVVNAFNIPSYAVEGWEADDIIATVCEKMKPIWKGKHPVTVVTGDKDLFQLVDDPYKIRVYIPGMNGRQSQLYQRQQVIEKMKITPEQITDYKGLAGDSSDNIPGIRGIGPKTATKLLTKYTTLEKIFDHLDDSELSQIVGPSVIKKLKANQQLALDSRSLATVDRQVEFDFEINQAKIHDYNKDEVVAMFKQLSFKSLMALLPDDEFEKGVQEALF